MRRAVLAGLLVAAACQPRGTSGLYVARTERDVTLIQLVETPDRRITGRYEDHAIDAGGTLADRAASLEGAASGDELTVTLKTAGAPGAGVTASGRIAGDALTLAGRNFSLTATRASLEDYQRALGALKVRAAQWRDGAEVAADLAEIRQESTRLRAALDRGHEFERAYAGYTARVAALERRALSLNAAQRGPARAEAARTQAASDRVERREAQWRNGLDRQAAQTGSLVQRVAALCAARQGATAVAGCAEADADAADFRGLVERTHQRFAALDRTYRDAHRRQDALIGRIQRN
jgi:hypothetical protein